MQLLKADTLTKVLIGPVVAVGDGFTPITTLSLSTADEAELLKHDAAAVTSISGNTFAAITSADGYYNLTITAAQLDTEGRLTVLINDDSLCLPVRHDFMVVNANVYDSLYGAATTDYLQTDVIQVGGSTEDIATETKQDVIDGNVDTINTATGGLGGAAMRGTDSAATATSLATAQTDLDTITGSDGVTLATAQALYAPAKVGDSMDVSSISGDTTAADNLEATFDGTGYSNGAAPATQTQVGNLAVGSAAISVVSESDTVTTGTEVNDYTVTDQVDQTYHEISDDGGVLEMYYQFDVTGNGVATDVEMTGRLVGANDTIGVFAYNWGGASWDQIGSMEGSNGSTDGVSAFSLLTRHTGTGANLGKVRVRGYAASGLTSATLYIDQAFVSYAVVAQSVGYAQGRVWVDTADGTAGIESYVNGVADNKVLTFADALTIGANLGIHEYNVSPDSTLTLAANLTDAIVYGVGYELDFAGFDCSSTHFYHGSPVNGIVLSATAHTDVLDSIINNVTVNDIHFTNCTFTGTVTMGSVASTLRVIKCQSVGGTAPIFDFGTASSVAHNLNVNGYNGHLDIRNMGNSGTDTMRVDGGGGHLIVNANCTSGTIYINGDWKVDNSGSVTIVRDDTSTDVSTILVDTADMQPKVDKIPLSDGTNSWNATALAAINAEADTAISDAALATAANLATVDGIVDDLKIGVILGAAATGTLSTTVATTNLTGYTDDQLIGRIITVTSGPADGESSDITDYANTGGTITFTAMTLAMQNGNTFKIT